MAEIKLSMTNKSETMAILICNLGSDLERDQGNFVSLL